MEIGADVAFDASGSAAAALSTNATGFENASASAGGAGDETGSSVGTCDKTRDGRDVQGIRRFEFLVAVGDGSDPPCPCCPRAREGRSRESP